MFGFVSKASFSRDEWARLTFSVGLIDHHFRIEQVGRSALLLAQAFRTFAVFYFTRVNHSRPADNFPAELQTC